MATITAAGDGNWGTGGTWVGGVKPGVGDTAETSTYTITIDEDVNCDALQNTANGKYVMTQAAGAHTITADVITTGTQACLQCSHTDTSGNYKVIGNVTGGAAATSYGVNVSSTGTLTIQGNCTGGSTTTAAGAYTNTGTINITGNAVGNAGAGAPGVRVVGAGTINLTGSATGGGGSSAHGVYLEGAGTLNMTGDATGGTAAGARGVTSTAAGTVTITGNATGGTNATAYGVNNGSTGSVTISGYAKGDVAPGAYQNNAAGSITVKQAVGGDDRGDSPGVECHVTAGTITVEQIRYGTAGASPTRGPVLFATSATNRQCIARVTGGSDSELEIPPATGKVRDGQAFGVGRTGTDVLPTEAQTESGVGFGADGTEFTGSLVAGGGLVTHPGMSGGMNA